MKPTRIAKILAVILAITMLPLWTVGCGGGSSEAVFAGLRDQLHGEVELDTDDAATQTYIAALDAEVKNLLTYQEEEGGWPDKIVTPGDSVQTFHYKSIYKLAVAYTTDGSEYYHSGSAFDAAELALQQGYDVVFGASQIGANSKTFTMEMRQICALNLVRSVMLLEDDLSSSDIEQWFSILDMKFPAPVGEGLDKIRTTYICAAYYSYAGNTENVAKFTSNFIDDVLALTDSGDGRYADGSYIWNLGNVSTLEAGVEAVDLLADLYVALKDTDYALPETTVDALYNWVVSMKHSLYNGIAVASSLTSNVTQGERIGGEAVAVMLKVAEICDEEKANAIKALVKSYGSTNADYKGDGKFAVGLGSYGAYLYSEVVKNDDIVASADAIGAHSYAAADTLSVIAANFGVSVSMNSVRTNKFDTAKIPYVDPDALETVAHNGNLWYSRDGMFNLYTADYNRPSTFWSNINTLRLPGTTVDNRPRKNIDVYSYNGMNNYAGSAVLGVTAVAAMWLNGNNAEYRSDLTAKKAWFVFDDKIVCLGADINNTTLPKEGSAAYKNHQIETIIENIYYYKFTSINTSIVESATLSSGATDVLKTMTVDGNENAALYFSRYGGVYIPASNLNVKAKLSTTDGGNYAEIWVEHTEKVLDADGNLIGYVTKDGSYEYAIYPSTSLNMREFYEMINAGNGTADYTVLNNDKNVQAVRDNKSGAVGYVFWTGASCNGITTDFACNIMVKETDTQITIAIADISHAALDNPGGVITLGGYYNLVSADNGLTLNGNTITVDRNVASNGQTLTIVLSK